MKGLVIAAPMSGSGKTTLSLGLMAALVRRGLAVQPFKVGPDFIDPGHHRRAAGRRSANLDGWMLARESNLALFRRQAAGADVVLVEGVMGLFDGCDGRSEAGSSAQMAKWLGLPVLLVVGAGGMARSAAALARGFAAFDPALRLIGVVFNFLGSRRHLDLLREALADAGAPPCLGGLTRDGALRIPERHLGLVTGEEHPLNAAALAALARAVERGLDLDRLLDLLPEVPQGPEPAPVTAAPGAHGVRIGIARDAAFCFYYDENLRLLEAAGAELVAFSPLVDRQLPPDLDGLIFGGGYPELFAAALAGNTGLQRQVAARCREGMPIYAECGGFMYLCRELTDAAGARFPMVGIFPLATRMLPRLKALGYRQVTLARDTPLGPAGMDLRGHEFHYSELLPGGTPPCAYHLSARQGCDPRLEGYLEGRCLGSYVHLHFGSACAAAANFVDACREYRGSGKRTP
jgi:cobyrinic acid a,c-diamide synthase